ncbi:unnamed protein product [Eruca vesicaria subsp. sativa]|uniref:Bifunctional inhibitor/plant lipid transfer protein/seed storage helical domain-containing protein n=1 Tax=Eruca vesicaria subsp. sativa TaxID=29727 RepID=A0ABC8LE72_ERUVS|nr:unnamed protein product [Eruca vesicaria subsp. sativa]
MGKNNTIIIALAMVLITAMMMEEAKSYPICNTDTNDLQNCYPAVTGDSPPGPDCCAAAKSADLECLCPYLTQSGLDPSKVKSVLASCDVDNPSGLPW